MKGKSGGVVAAHRIDVLFDYLITCSRMRRPPNQEPARCRHDFLEQPHFLNTSLGHFDVRPHPHWPDRFFSRIVSGYLARTSNDGGRVGDARSFLLDASGLLEFALPIMSAVAANARAADGLSEPV
jgi:hypothetical protein